MSDTDFDLRGLVREVLNTSTLADPGAIADEVFRRVPRKAHGDALAQALRVFARQVMSEERSHTQIATAPASPGRSAKVSAIRDHWQRSLRDRIHVGDREWKLLADCTRTDLLAAAAERQQQADRNAAKARQYDALARLLTAHDVERVRDLPAEALMNALGAAA